MKTVFSSSKQRALLFAFRFALPGLLLMFGYTASASYTATLTPTTAGIGVPTAFTMTITSGVNNLGAITIAIPAGVTGPATPGDVTLTPPGGKAWTVNSVTATLISLSANGSGNANRLGNGQSIAVQFTATVLDGNPKPLTVTAYTTQNFTGGGAGSLLGDQPTINQGQGCVAPTTRLYVNGSLETSGTGGSWACALKQLSEAVAIAEFTPAITEIWVAKGTYKPTTGSDRAASILITRNNLSILGGFASGAVSAADANPVANLTTISGDIGAPVDPSDNSYHLVTIHNVGEGSPVTIDGFLLTGGNANTAGTLGGSGGALLGYDNAALVHVKRCIFAQNKSILYGGAVFTSRSNIIFQVAVFAANTSASGGAMYGWFSSPIFTSTGFAGNTASLSGGGYYGNFGTPVFHNSIFTGNTAVTEGGAVYQNQSGGWYDNCVFSNNSSQWSGAIHQLNTATSTVRNCTFFGNAASNALGAGAIFLGYNGCSTDTRNSIFWRNRRAGVDNAAGADVKNTYNTVNISNFNMLQANSALAAGVANLIDKDPGFVDETDPDGPDNLPGTPDDGLELMSASLGVNSGDITVVAGLLDAALAARIACGIVDRGAYENEGCVAAPAKNVTQNIKKNIEPVAVSGVVANPFTSDLQVRYSGTEKATLKVYDVSGKPTYNNNSISQGITHIDAGTWGKGMYQVVLSTVSGKQMIFKAMKL